jgi:hypothetical protein
MLVDLETKNMCGDERPVVYVVWSGIKSVVSTHSIYCIVTKEEFAQKRVDAYTFKEKDYYLDHEQVDYWYETVWLDHLLGESMITKARELLRTKFRTGD